jgi:hypothetical protein
MPRFCKDLFDNLEKIEKILPQLWSDSLHRFSLVCMKSIMIRLGISSTLQMGKAFGDIIMPPPLFIPAFSVIVCQIERMAGLYEVQGAKDYLVLQSEETKTNEVKTDKRSFAV